jgi:hypothetical protein
MSFEEDRVIKRDNMMRALRKSTTVVSLLIAIVFALGSVSYVRQYIGNDGNANGALALMAFIYGAACFLCLAIAATLSGGQ